MKGDEVRVYIKEFLTPSNLYLGNKEIIKNKEKNVLVVNSQIIKILLGNVLNT